jgi:hypothetical protein
MSTLTWIITCGVSGSILYKVSYDIYKSKLFDCSYINLGLIYGGIIGFYRGYNQTPIFGNTPIEIVY